MRTTPFLLLPSLILLASCDRDPVRPTADNASTAIESQPAEQRDIMFRIGAEASPMQLRAFNGLIRRYDIAVEFPG